MHASDSLCISHVSPRSGTQPADAVGAQRSVIAATYRRLCKRVLLRSQELAADSARRAHLAPRDPRLVPRDPRLAPRDPPPPSPESPVAVGVSAHGVPRRLDGRGDEPEDPPDGRGDEADEEEEAQHSAHAAGGVGEHGQRMASTPAAAELTGRRRSGKRRKARRRRRGPKKSAAPSVGSSDGTLSA